MRSPPSHTTHANHGPWLDCFRRCYDNTPYQWASATATADFARSPISDPLPAAQVWPRRPLTRRRFLLVLLCLGIVNGRTPLFRFVSLSACPRSAASRLGNDTTPTPALQCIPVPALSHSTSCQYGSRLHLVLSCCHRNCLDRVRVGSPSCDPGGSKSGVCALWIASSSPIAFGSWLFCVPFDLQSTY